MWAHDPTARFTRTRSLYAQVLIEDGIAVGVVGRRGATAEVASQPLHIRARCGVVVAAGSLHSPCLLLRSGVGGRHVGRHLRLHPATGVTAQFGDPVRCYEGAPMTSVCDVAETCPSGTKFGAKVEVPSLHPGLMCAAVGWRGRDAMAADVAQLNNSSCLLVLQASRCPWPFPRVPHARRSSHIPPPHPRAYGWCSATAATAAVSLSISRVGRRCGTAYDGRTRHRCSARSITRRACWSLRAPPSSRRR